MQGVKLDLAMIEGSRAGNYGEKNCLMAMMEGAKLGLAMI